MGEKGNLTAQPLAALDAIPLDLLKSSPETLNAWMDTYLKARELHDLQKAEVAVEEAAGAAKKDASGPNADGGAAS